METTSLVLAAALAAFFHVSNSFDVPKTFGCKNTLIADDWREMVLKFHNDKRRLLSKGSVTSKDGNVAPWGTNINELVWDCNLEYYAWSQSCGGQIDATKFMSNKETFSPGKKCNSTTTIKDILKKWWDEVKGIDLKASQAYVAGLEHFAPMAAAEAKGFACSTKICSSSESDLLCVYDKLLNINDNIYTKGDTADKICDTCNQNKLCTNSLCQYDYTLADERPERACKDDKLTNDLEAVVVNMHNYYRRLSATGWAEDKKDGYAPTAKQLKALEYDCAGLGAQSLAKAANCPEKAPDADAGASLNHFYVREYETPKAELFEKAIRKWAEEVKEVGVGKENTYTEGKGFDSYAHMLFQDATKVGCAVEICKNFGASVVICQYNAVPQDDDPIYTVGKPCGGCTTCSKLGGLCA